MRQPQVLSADMLRRLLNPSAITVVGASPNGHVTEHLVRNLRNRSCAFAGAVHLVNPRYTKLFDLECFPTPESIPGSPGLVYLLLPGARCMAALNAIAGVPDGVIVFPDASRDANGYETEIAAWGAGRSVAVLGPQSNGLVSPRGRVNGLLIPIIDRIEDGHVAVLAQSGGVLGGLVKFFAQRGVGIHSALEYGTACMLTPWALGLGLLADPEVRLIALYADGLDSVRDFGAFLEAAHEARKPVVVMIAGVSRASRQAIGSHSGMAATPRRVLEGVTAQHGAVLAHDLDELGWSVEAIVRAGFAAPSGPQVALFSDSGGGGIAIAEAIEGQRVALEPPDGAAGASLRERFGEAMNPFDFGSASMGMVREQAADVHAVAADPKYGTFAFASTIGLARGERSVHARQLDEFASTVEAAARTPFIASPLPFLSDEEGPSGSALYGNGSKESAVKMRALSTLAGAIASAAGDSAGGPHPPGEVITGGAATSLLAGLPLKWPRQVTVSSVDEIEEATLTYPVVVKTEAGLAHRARAGGVLAGLTRFADVRNAVTFLLGRFDGPVSIAELVAHDVEYFLGAQRAGDDFFVLLGLGGEQAEAAGLRLAPVDSEQARRFAIERTPNHAAAMADLVLAFQEWLLRAERVEAVDLNPVVPVPGGFMALDAKIHRA